VSNAFADFFREKVAKLSNGPILPIHNPLPSSPLVFTLKEVCHAAKKLSNKRSFGTDKIPQSFFKDCFEVMGLETTNLLNNFAKSGLPCSLKTARVLPLHKKDDKKSIPNYRPISNLSPFSKIFERCLLSRLEVELPGSDGTHQHGFRTHHSTETALLLIQSKLAKILDNGSHGLIYSVDLSAAFDLLRPDKFHELFKNKISEGLLFSIADFLMDRRFQVELGDVKSIEKSLDRGCVQGSILGPKLFNLYLGELANKLGSSGVEIISYADDTYVIITALTVSETVKLTEETIIKHIDYLKDLGMTVNESKTEAMWIGKTSPIDSIKIGSEDCKLVKNFKALGIFIQGDLSWDTQAESAINKGKKLVSNFKVLRKYLTEDQFLKAASANYYSTIFYGASVWFESTKAIQKTKFQSLHFRLLRTATRDYGFHLSHDQLSTRCKRATPKQWSNYITASLILKTFRSKQPVELFEVLKRTYFEQPRSPGIGMFFDSSCRVIGRQSLENRLIFMRSIKLEWNTQMPLSNDQIRIELKKTFFPYFRQL